jgi:hypothetical protein
VSSHPARVGDPLGGADGTGWRGVWPAERRRRRLPTLVRLAMRRVLPSVSLTSLLYSSTSRTTAPSCTRPRAAPPAPVEGRCGGTPPEAALRVIGAGRPMSTGSTGRSVTKTLWDVGVSVGTHETSTPVVSATRGDGGDVSGGLGLGSPCSYPGGRRFKSCPRYQRRRRPEALSHWDRASCHVWPVTRSVTRSVTRDLSAVPLRLIAGRIVTGRDI